MSGIKQHIEDEMQRLLGPHSQPGNLPKTPTAQPPLTPVQEVRLSGLASAVVCNNVPLIF